jgi:hypothetical protein
MTQIQRKKKLGKPLSISDFDKAAVVSQQDIIAAIAFWKGTAPAWAVDLISALRAKGKVEDGSPPNS